MITLSILLTLSAWYFSKKQLDEKITQRFHHEADQVVELVKERMALYENALWGGVALFDASEEVTQPEWVMYANSLHIDTTYPGINGIGVIYNIRPSHLEAYLVRERKWRPDYKIHPQHNEPEHWPITYIEPAGPNRKAVGLDMAFEANRYTAIKKARDTGKARVTGPITLVQDAKQTPGFLFYTPFYRDGQKPQTIDERRKHIVGVTYAPFIMSKLMEGTLAQHNRHVDVRISDEQEVLFDDLDNDDGTINNKKPHFRKQISIDMYGRRWAFDIWSNASFTNATSANQPTMILIGGMIIDLLVIALFFAISRSNRRAIRYAKEKTQELEHVNSRLSGEISERKHAEDIVRLSEQRMMLAIQGTSDGLWDWLDVNEEAEWWSPRFYELLGYEEGEIESNLTQFKKMLHPDDVDRTSDAVRDHLEHNEPFDIEYRLKTKDGEFRWFRARGMAQRDEAGKPTRMAGSIQDIHDQKRAQQEVNRYAGDLWRAREEVKASQKRFEIAVDGASDGLWDWNILTNEIWYSHRFKSLLGYTDKDFQDLFESWKSVIHPDNRQSVMDALTRHLETSQPFDVEYRAQTKRGEYRWYRSRGKAIRDKSGEAIRMAGSIQDITDRKQVEVELARRETEQRLILNNLPVLVASLDKACCYRTANSTYLRMFALKENEIRGKHIRDILTQDGWEKVREYVSQVLAGKSVTYEVELPFRIGQRIMQITYVPDANEAGEIQGFYVLGIDITDRKQAETELAWRAQELEKSNKELDDFAYIASHDLKEPLRGIHNYATFLIEDYQDKIDEDGMAKLSTLQRLTQRMELLIDTLLQFSRVGRVDMAIEETDLGQVFGEVVESLHVRLDEIGVDVRTPTPLPTVRCDRARIGEVFRNLVTNAMKYNDKPEKWIEVGVMQDDETQIEISKDSENETGGQQVFYVRDNGIGIPEKHKDSIFRIFKRLHGRDKFGGGTGAGLTIVKKIVERHGGQVWIESTRGEGTTFKFTLGKAA